MLILTQKKETTYCSHLQCKWLGSDVQHFPICNNGQLSKFMELGSGRPWIPTTCTHPYTHNLSLALPKPAHPSV